MQKKQTETSSLERTNAIASQNFTNNIIRNIYDLVDFITKDNGGKDTCVARNLNQDEKCCYFTEPANYCNKDSLLAKPYTKSSETFNISDKKEWVEEYSWHIYNPSL